MQDIFLLQNPWRTQPNWQVGDVIPRRIQPAILNWLNEPEIIVIKGARQVGKTTLITQIIYDLLYQKRVHPENIFYFSFDDRDLRNLILQNPKSIFNFIQQQRRGKERLFIFFDEIQKAPLILELLKIYFNSGQKDFKFLISGSSSLELSKGVSESLLGRVVNFHLYPLTFQEFLTLRSSPTLVKFIPEIKCEMEKFLLEFSNFSKLLELSNGLEFYRDEITIRCNEYLLIGGYPGVVKKDIAKGKILLRDIKQTYIERDIIETLRIEKHFSFSQLIELLSYQIGELVSIDELCRNLKVSFVTLKNFINILEKTYIVEFLPPYFVNQRKAIRKNKKVYFLDTGFRNASIGLTNLPGNPYELGHLAENLVFNILQRSNSYLFNESSKLFFFRTYDGAEIDFLMKKDDKILPVEVKYQSFTTEKTPLVMQNFMKVNGCQQGVVVTKDFIGRKGFDFGEIYFIPLSLLVFAV